MSDAPPVLQASGRMPWPTLSILALGGFAIGTEGFVVAGILGGIARDLDVPVAVAGQTVTVFAVAYAVGAPLLTGLTSGVRLRRVLVTSMALFAVFNLLAAAATSIWMLDLWRALCAGAAGLYLPAAAGAASRLVPDRYRGRALAVVLGGQSAGTVLGAPLGIVVEQQLSWRGTFVLVAGLALVAVVGLALRGPAVGTADPLPLRERLAPLRSPELLLSLVVTTVGMTGGYAPYTYLGPLFGPDPDIGERWLSLLVAAFGLGGVLGAWCGGSLADRWGAQRAISVSLGLMTLNFVLSPLTATTLPSALAFLVAWGITGWAFLPAQQHKLVGLMAGQAPLVISLNASAVYVGIASGAALGGVVVATVGAGSLWMVAAGCGAFALLVHTLSGRPDRR
ncbi:MFS transporter [Pseudonocardia sp. ICBG601]|uniref:MFS transporter n=1 Tax=Pseudonocardia sp. ICBG601 TaxID=2846759 RepID=UPI001CF66E12|nr:MFS transporter [Pseudonocardia sp. ICBG601]